jgi:hypothetical protein
MLTTKDVQAEEEFEFKDDEFLQVLQYVQRSPNNKFVFIRDDKPFMNINKIDGMLFFDRLS